MTATVYSDPQLTHNPAAGLIIPSAWGDVMRDDVEFLIDSPRCSVFNSAVQSLTTSTDTVLTADTENYDNDGCHSIISQTSRITIQTAGRYLLNATCTFDISSTGIRKVEFWINGTTVLHGQLLPTAPSPFVTDMQATRTRTFVVGDYVEVRAYQNTGGNLNVTLREFLANFLGR